MRSLLTNIRGLVQVREDSPITISGREMSELPVLDNAWLLLENGRFHSWGQMDQLNERADEEFDCSGRFVFPAWCDPHTHIVYAAPREAEFVYRIKGMSYEEIAEQGGGILNSARRLQQSSEDELYEGAAQRVREVISFGTTAMEIKSGYGLSVDAEIKMLRVIARLKEDFPIEIRANFLGAHAIPMDYRDDREAYIRLITEEMLPRIKAEGLADYIDVFCDRGFFTPEESDRILQAGAAAGLQAKIHANELDYSGGVQVGVSNKALSVDHLECVGEDEIEALRGSATMPTLLPGTAFFLNIDYAPARKMIDAGLPVALATDYNPGSTPSGNMPFVLSLSCLKMKMLPQECVNAATINAAYAMGLHDSHGQIRSGAPANCWISQAMPSMEFLMYAYGSKLVDKVFVNGRIVD